MHELLQLLQTDVNAANAVGAIASAIAAFLALFISFVSVVVSLWALRIQRRHNVLSIRPLPEVAVADYENSLRVKVRNNGSGPMMVKSVSVSDGTASKSSLVDWMPAPLPQNRPWTTFSHSLVNRSLLPGGEIVLLELTEHEGESGFATCRDLTRAALCVLSVTVQYTDVYGTNFPIYIKGLDWFGRHEYGT